MSKISIASRRQALSPNTAAAHDSLAETTHAYRQHCANAGLRHQYWMLSVSLNEHAATIRCARYNISRFRYSVSNARDD
ncbi:hypothetical protein LGN03_20210 [Burkholderia multivorans]|nr:hypothetical protein [Burkholderia multivorans]